MEFSLSRHLQNLKKEPEWRHKSIDRFVYSTPEDAGMNSSTLKRIEPIVAEAIKMGATPGCQVLVAKNGKVVYEKSFGSLTYDKE